MDEHDETPPGRSHPRAGEPGRDGPRQSPVEDDEAIGAGASADQHAQDVRHDESDEADGPGRRGGGSAQQGDGDERGDAHDAEAGAEGRGLLVAEGQRVETAPAGRGDDEPGGDERTDPGEREHVALGEGAEGPEAVGVEDVGVAHGDGAGDRVERRGECDAGEHEARDADPRAAPGHRPHEHGGRGRADEREPHMAGDGAHAPDRDGRDDGEGGSRVDAQHARLGEGVAGERLHDDTGRAERVPAAAPTAVRGSRSCQTTIEEGLRSWARRPSHSCTRVSRRVPMAVPTSAARHRRARGAGREPFGNEFQLTAQWPRTCHENSGGRARASLMTARIQRRTLGPGLGAAAAAAPSRASSRSAPSTPTSSW